MWLHARHITLVIYILQAVLSAAIPSDLVEFLKERNEGLSDLCGDTRSKIGWILYEDADQKNLLAVLGSQRKVDCSI